MIICFRTKVHFYVELWRPTGKERNRGARCKSLQRDPMKQKSRYNLTWATRMKLHLMWCCQGLCISSQNSLYSFVLERTHCRAFCIRMIIWVAAYTCMCDYKVIIWCSGRLFWRGVTCLLMLRCGLGWSSSACWSRCQAFCSFLLVNGCYNCFPPEFSASSLYLYSGSSGNAYLIQLL